MRLVGAGLSIASVAYIIWRFSTTSSVTELLHAWSGAFLLHVALGALIYTCALLLLASTWWWLIGAYCRSDVPFLSVSSAYATSQFAKYLPGNVGQYVARHAILRRMQWSHNALVAAALTEVSSLVCAALLWSLPLTGTMLSRYLGLAPMTFQVLLGILFALGLMAIWIILRMPRARQWVPLERPLRLIGVVAAHVLFFGLMIISLRVVATGIAAQFSTLTLAGVATTSWLAGFLVVGSPGGLGVREAVFVELLSAHGSVDTALLMAAAFRLVTFSGDFLVMLIGGCGFAWIRLKDGVPSK
ncbi:MAG: lysylphosphatidylglycerol synthase domain-containing protein [Dyella sp.]|uniref:lysylphosphatidylglycerol synthase domain-containing protein n=1 Tax=Dyella sp. TaxID=1869338 RepID=UPI003F80FC15